MESNRERTRRELVARITETARHHLGEVGPAQLSMRAIARDLGLASSALYRYFPSRDALLTALITEAYDALGEAAEQAARPSKGGPREAGERWARICRACRTWALAHPHEFALLYGSPVPGYAAPQTTIGPATRVTRLMAEVLRDALAAGELTAPQQQVPGLPLVTEETREVAALEVAAPHEDLIERSLVMWVVLMGALTFELFGHLEQVVTDRAAWFDAAMAVAAEGVGLYVPITAD
jgi:AcrR family transcriptional regulator